jgi:hypothetical protein
MSDSESFPPAQLAPLAVHPVIWAAVRRVVAMTGVWMGFGVLVGVCLATGGNWGGYVANVLAGLNVLSPMGVLVAAIGRWKESLVGGVLGLAAGTAFAVAQGQPDAGQAAAFGVIFGGLVGATVVTAFYRLPRLVIGALRRSGRSEGRVEHPVAV